MSDFAINLYLGLDEEHEPTAENVARIILAWSDVVRTAGSEAHSDAALRLEFLGTYKGSLGIRTRVSNWKSSILTKSFATGVLFAVGRFLGEWALNYGLDEIADALRSKDAPEAVRSLSDEDIQKIAAETARVLESANTRREAQRLFDALESEPAIESVGVTGGSEEKPEKVIGRALFPLITNSAIDEPLPSPPKNQTRLTSLELRRPILDGTDPKKWGFVEGEERYNASIKDAEFLLWAFPRTEPPLRMSQGITMRVQVIEKLEVKKGDWKVTDRSVGRVIKVTVPGMGETFYEDRWRPAELFPPQNDDTDDGEDAEGDG